MYDVYTNVQEKLQYMTLQFTECISISYAPTVALQLTVVRI